MARGGDSNPWRYFGIGLEYAGVILIFAFVGWYFFDRSAERQTPWGLVAGALIGFVGGTYNMIKTALKANRDDNSNDTQAK